MLLRIDGKDYSITDALTHPSLYDLHALKLSTGMGLQSLMKATDRIDEYKGDFMQAFEESDLLLAFMAIIWLARRCAGERLTMEEANSFPVDEIEMIEEDSDRAGKAAEAAEDAADPTDPAKGLRPVAGHGKRGKIIATSSKTSKRS